METYDNHLRSIVKACYWIQEASQPDMFRCKCCKQCYSQEMNTFDRDICLQCEDYLADAEREIYGR